jgi:hypothetical protein
VSVLKLLDGTKAYVHAVIDNFSRRVLAWTVADHLDPMNTHAVLVEAGGHFAGPSRANVVMDSGVENLNGAVDKHSAHIAPASLRPLEACSSPSPANLCSISTRSAVSRKRST